MSTNTNKVCLRNAIHIASSSEVNTVEDGSLGPIQVSCNVVRFFHLATVLGLIEYFLAKVFKLS